MDMSKGLSDALENPMARKAVIEKACESFNKAGEAAHHLAVSARASGKTIMMYARELNNVARERMKFNVDFCAETPGYSMLVGTEVELAAICDIKNRNSQNDRMTILGMPVFVSQLVGSKEMLTLENRIIALEYQDIIDPEAYIALKGLFDGIEQ